MQTVHKSLQSAAVFINRGDSFSDQAFVETESISTLGTDDVLFVRFSGLGIVEAGTALSKSSDTLNVNVDDSSIGVDGSDRLYIKALGVTNAMLAGSIEAGKLAGSIGDGKAQPNHKREQSRGFRGSIEWKRRS